jgi:outer membrane lipoprotein-sorting protein
MTRMPVRWSVCVAVVALGGRALPAEPDATGLVDAAETLLWGKTLVADAEMTITTPAWTKALGMRVWMERPGRSFVRVTAPPKEAGICSLRIASEMWNYVPAIERTIKIPPSMMLQPWMGSDFSNDDLVKESSLVNDYAHRVVGVAVVDGAEAYRVEGLPKPGAAVVWGRIVYTIRKRDRVPLKLEYFDERGTPLRVLTYSDVREVGGRAIPTRWEMQPLDKPGKRTTIVVRSAAYDGAVAADVFSLRNLR